MKAWGPGRVVFGDGDVAATQSIEGVLVQLHEALACFSQGFHGRVEGYHDVLAATVELDVVQGDICQACMADLVEGFLAEGFEIATDLWRLVWRNLPVYRRLASDSLNQHGLCSCG